MAIVVNPTCVSPKVRISTASTARRHAGPLDSPALVREEDQLLARLRLTPADASGESSHLRPTTGATATPREGQWRLVAALAAERSSGPGRAFGGVAGARQDRDADPAVPHRPDQGAASCNGSARGVATARSERAREPKQSCAPGPSARGCGRTRKSARDMASSAGRPLLRWRLLATGVASSHLRGRTPPRRGCAGRTQDMCCAWESAPRPQLAHRWAMSVEEP